MKKIVPLFILLAVCFTSCRVSNKQIIRQQHLEEGVESPTTVEELKDAIEKYQKRVADIQLAQSQIGIWYKILGTRYLDQKMYGEALKCFQEALKYYPNNQNLYYYVGVCAGYMSHACVLLILKTDMYVPYTDWVCCMYSSLMNLQRQFLILRKRLP